MKGILQKTNRGEWTVTHSPKDIEIVLPLHPDNVRFFENEYVYYGAVGFKPTEIDFDIVNEEFDNGKGGVYAKFNSFNIFSGIEVKPTTYKIEVKEISDEEIEREAKLHSNYYEFTAGAKWYREQLKKQ